MTETRNGAYWSQQSPIDINDSLHADGLKPLRFLYPETVTGTLELPSVDPGFSFKVDPESTASLFFAGQPCPLRKIHFHGPAEHTFHGHAHDLEIHLVHEILAPTWGSTRVVVAVFVEGRDEEGPPRARVSAPFVGREIGDSVTLNPNHCIPESLDFYRYEGSLTTPDYDEVVSWFLMRTPLSAVKSDLEVLVRNVKHDARPAQPSQRRFVLRNFALP